MANELPSNATRLTIITLIIMTMIFAFLLPYAKEPLLQITPFVGAYDTTLVFNSLLTALYFYCLYFRLNARGNLLLACGYLYDALMILPHGLSFPGLFSETGLFGDTQTTVWIYMLWHGAFPLFSIGYTTIPEDEVRRGQMRAVLLSLGATMLAVLLLMTLLVEVGGTLPALLVQNRYTNAMHVVVGLVWFTGLVAVVCIWGKPNRTMIDLWLTVVMVGWVYDVALSAVWNHGRYDLGFYAGRVDGLLADGFVLVMLINETSRLKELLAAASKWLFEYNPPLEERVRERTQDLANIERQLAQAQKMEAIG